MMTLNVGRADQVARGIIGTALILLAGVGALAGAWRVAALVVGAIAVFTAAAGFCPIYRALGRSSCTR
ncbi:MAG TPA: DUF2892 domain-containing protein [Longimicrobiales bacterium]|nr:DUF2892 domain-containing protein [Longimicrobiales bacterium]